MGWDGNGCSERTECETDNDCNNVACTIQGANGTCQNGICSDATAGGLLNPPDGEFTSVTVGYDHICALDAEGRAHCWDRNGPMESP